jgi:excisionase family DNA binding protein
MEDTVQSKPTEIEPAFVSIADAARYVGISEWSVKDLLRQGVLQARKSGRRTLIEFASVKQHAASLPAATFAAPARQVA